MDYDSLQAHVLRFGPTTDMLPQCANISIGDDQILELTETFSVVLTSNMGNRVLLDAPAIVFIEDDDGKFLG